MNGICFLIPSGATLISAADLERVKEDGGEWKINFHSPMAGGCESE